jgi:hypothetical protein
VSFFRITGGHTMNYISAKEAADKWGITRRRVQLLCEQNRIPGVFKIGNAWAIPVDAEKPQDKRKYNIPPKK